MLTISMSGDKSRAGSNITFTLMLGEGAASTYVWDFGDGTPAMRGTRSSTSHAYQQTGVYTLQATATNPVGSESTSVEIYIGAPEIHSVKVNGDYSEPGNDITITVTIGEGSATMYEWDFGDGRVETTSGHDRVEVLTHSYADHGVYTVWVTASNPIGKSSMSVVVHIGG
jgi:PKD repeat protein